MPRIKEELNKKHKIIQYQNWKAHVHDEASKLEETYEVSAWVNITIS